jgi:hypothetical protein
MVSILSSVCVLLLYMVSDRKAHLKMCGTEALYHGGHRHARINSQKWMKDPVKNEHLMICTQKR